MSGDRSTLDERRAQTWVARIDDDANVRCADLWDGRAAALPDSPDPRDGKDLGTALAIDPAGSITVVGSTDVREELDGDTTFVISQDWVGEHVP